jgi:diguanylate cyclase (GGDEF)-like protein
METRRFLSPFLALICVAAGLIGLAVLAIGITIWGLRSDAIDAASKDAGNLALVIAEQTRRSIEPLDTILGEIQEYAIALGIETPDDFRRMFHTEHMFLVLKNRLAFLSHAAVISLTDISGQLVNSTRRWPTYSVNFADRDFVRHLQTSDTREMFVSVPVTARTTGTWTIYFSKRVYGTGGGFAGIATVGIDLSYFEKAYGSFASLPRQSFLFMRRDGTVLVRYPESKIRAGQQMPPQSPWYKAAERGGFYRSPGYFGSGPFLVAVRPVGKYPLNVNVAMLESAALSTWTRRAIFIVIGTLLAVLCSVFLLKSLFSQFRRLSRSEASLAEREAWLAEKSSQLESTNLRLDAALNNMSQGLCMFDKHERLVVCNERYLRMYGVEDLVKPGCILSELLHARASAGSFSGKVDQYISSLRERLTDGKDLYLTSALEDGRVIAVLNQPMVDGGWVATHEDITERQRAEAQIAHMAHHDALTDLANRVLFRKKMEEAQTWLRLRDEQFAIFIFDLDLFKAVNDSLGHPVGDALLRAIAQRLQACVGEHDTVGRLGGDEFAIIQRAQGDQKQCATALAHTLLEKITAPYDIDGNRIVIGISIGIALAPRDGEDASQLLKNADLALYRAKSDGRNGFRFFESEMDNEARLHRALEVDLRNALTQGEFEMYYQQVVDIASLRACGAEALVRWNHPRRGLIRPDDFIPMAEEIGLVIPLGEWILRKACSEAANWPKHLKLAVNLSPVQFRCGKLVEIVSAALASTGLPAERLELEITESVLLQKDAENIAVLHELTKLGVSIVLDDFGTGYSSLSYLRMFPFHKIKIDKSFVAELPYRPDCGAIVCAMTTLGQSLDIVTTAEGVETWEQLKLLRAAGCTQAQGYLFSRPRPARDLDFEPLPEWRMNAA